ncbi:hypothetical protein DB88DRAFT_542580 [Papiliotrema laurentii]|uniref:Uncharacterized protein n=1 Tax=Papiliotrema laurentii TaxID=5418 RepID=A0AAD9CWM6_PAPLA|nr:hypothetical protein DB88DRAFT_542580 [Papiliotrema laurentii]
MSPSLIDKFIWIEAHSSPSTMTTYAAMGCTLKGLLLGIVLVNSWRYFSLFYRVDAKIVLFGIALGTASSIAQTGLNAYQVQQLILYTPVNYSAILRNDAWEIMSVAFITAHFNAAATAFYSWRAWKKKWMMAVLVSGIFVSYALVFPLMINGARMPELNAANFAKLQSWLVLEAKFYKAWGCTSVGVDISICTLLVWLFLRKKESMFHAEPALLKKLLILVFETM